MPYLNATLFTSRRKQPSGFITHARDLGRNPVVTLSRKYLSLALRLQFRRLSQARGSMLLCCLAVTAGTSEASKVDPQWVFVPIQRQ